MAMEKDFCRFGGGLCAGWIKYQNIARTKLRSSRGTNITKKLKMEEEKSYKKVARRGPVEQQDGPERANLAVLGMRIRQAVSEGYNVPNRTYNGYSGHSIEYIGNGPSDGHQGDSGNSMAGVCDVGGLRRSLPQHMSEPPALLNQGSTVGTCSNLSDWEALQQRLEPLLQMLESAEDRSSSSGKRKYHNLQEPTIPEVRSLEDYRYLYGELKFDEAF